jgi:hypothetical protein
VAGGQSGHSVSVCVGTRNVLFGLWLVVSGDTVSVSVLVREMYCLGCGWWSVGTQCQCLCWYEKCIVWVVAGGQWGHSVSVCVGTRNGLFGLWLVVSGDTVSVCVLVREMYCLGCGWWSVGTECQCVCQHKKVKGKKIKKNKNGSW